MRKFLFDFNLFMLINLTYSAGYQSDCHHRHARCIRPAEAPFLISAASSACISKIRRKHHSSLFKIEGGMERSELNQYAIIKNTDWSANHDLRAFGVS